MLIEHSSAVDPRPQLGQTPDPARARADDRFRQSASAPGEERRAGAGVRRMRPVPPAAEVTPPFAASPAALLATMIHQMGGAVTSTAKGDYVDVTV